MGSTFNYTSGDKSLNINQGSQAYTAMTQYRKNKLVGGYMNIDDGVIQKHHDKEPNKTF